MKLAALLCLVAMPAVAQTPDTAPREPFATRLAHARTPLRVDGVTLSGPAADVLAEAVASARYVLIGEDHLSREIPRFTTALCRLMAPTGLRAMAVEIGPQAAEIVNDALRRPDRVSRLTRLLSARPDAVAFQNGVDESAMAAACARAAGPAFTIWGLDQEFLGASGLLLERMRAARPGPVASAAIARLAALDRSATAAALASGSPGQLLLYTIDDRQMQEAAAAIATDGGPRATALFAALAETRAIYLGQSTDGEASNARRARLMKRTLADKLATVPRSSRILFKFGDLHMAKGTNARHLRDLGNFVAERAEGDGATSLHIAVYGAAGTHALYGGVGRQVRNEPFVLAEDADYAWVKEAARAG